MTRMMMLAGLIGAVAGLTAHWLMMRGKCPCAGGGK